MPRFEYKNSISINSLVKLVVINKINNKTNGEDPFDHHEKGLSLYEVMMFLELYLTQKTLPDGVGVVNLNVKKSMPVVYDIREDIKTAILQKKLTIDDFDTKDCNEYRICYKTALSWCDNYPRPQYIFEKRPVKLNNIYLTLAALLHLLQESVNSNQEGITEKIEAYLADQNKEISESTINRIFTESRKSLT